MTKKRGKPVSNVKFSLVARLNSRLFFRLLWTFLTFDLLIVLLFGAGLLHASDRRYEDINALVIQRGVPSAEATEWMEAGDYIVSAGRYHGVGWKLPMEMSESDAPSGVNRYVELGEVDLFFGLIQFRLGEETRYIVESTEGPEGPYQIDLNLSQPMKLFALATQVVVVCQLFALISGLFQNAGIIKKVLRPIQELTAQTARFNDAMSAEELRELAGQLDAINAASLDDRIPLEGTQRELRDLTRSINAMLDRIDRAYHSQARFVSDASHELRTPIAVIQGYAKLLERWGKDDPEAMQESITAIRAEADSMKELVEQLLFLARGDNDSMKVDKEVFDLTAIAGQVLKETEMIDQTHPLTAEWGESVYVNADMGLIKQAVRILMDNAVKYSPEGGQIILRVNQQNGMVHLSVTDEGQGIAPEDLPHVFDRFYRTDESRTRQTGGTGLGLSIARWIAEKHDGTIDVLSRKGIGTRFRLELPVVNVPK